MATDVLLPSPDKVGGKADASVPRGFIKLEFQHPKRSTTVPSVDPEPYWTLDDLFLEINNIELQLSASSSASLSLSSKQMKSLGNPLGEETCQNGNKPFVMSVSEDMDMDSDDETTYAQSLTTGTRFSCVDIELSESDGSDDDSQHETIQPHLMVKKSPVEGVLFEFELEHQLKVKEEVRNKISALELDQQNESIWSSSAQLELEKFIESRHEMDRRLDKQYQRRTAEAIDKHLSKIQRDHEQRSQIEERRLRADAAIEEARKVEKALHEEKLRREKAKEEEEARLKAAKIAEEKQQAALEASRKASQEAAAKERAAALAAQREAKEQELVSKTETGTEAREENPVSKKAAGMRTMAADSALKAEAYRLRINEEASNALNSSLNKDFNRHERQILKHLKQITGTLQSVRTKARELVNIINDPFWPPSIAMLKFAEKVVSQCESRSGDHSIFACGYVIILVTSQVPPVMDLLMAELHKACIYTVPKHVQPTSPSSKTRGYLKMIGYREENGKMESSDRYLERLEGYMKLYAAMIQTEVEGVRNPLGLKEGWSWLARFLNNIPATRSSAFALEAFLKMAGFALWRKYRLQFGKILAVVSHNFLPALRKQQNEEVGDIIKRLERFLEDKVHLQEPEGWRLQSKLLSSELG